MRSAQVYRWQIPMDAGVVLRDRRLKTRDGLYVCLREGEREGWGEISPLPGFSQETWEDAQSVLLAWVNNWLAGDCAFSAKAYRGMHYRRCLPLPLA
ncbi:hypothetical protein EIMP300_37690 [Escherichia coli]|uniref:OSBS enolase-like N-terminal domain-containing protein n=1 Tax=Escherichia coli TaxID=562 RepID=A0A8S0FRS6_ECOLX|nr:hypothetical protein EIMP300_37690 [Escherichia coli]